MRDLLHCYRHPHIALGSAGEKGRGIYAVKPIKAGEMIETSPIIFLTEEEMETIVPTVLHTHVFEWEPEGTGALCQGMITMCNHSEEPNAKVQCDHENNTLEMHAARDIAPGEEVTISYGCDLWFDMVE